MGKGSNIEWCDHSWNLAWGCVEASPACDNCYARTFAHRYGYHVWGKDAPRRTFGAKYWAEPLKWNSQAAARGVRERVFCSSMTDVFLNDPVIDAEREKLWPLIEQTPWLDWLLLTKHPERFKTCLPAELPPTVWLGVTCEGNAYGWRVDMLRDVAERVTSGVLFVSFEPVLFACNAVDLSRIRWAIAGGESGRGARPMDMDWVRDLRDRANADPDCAFFLKQLGGATDKRGGENALLDGRRWTEFPVTLTGAHTQQFSCGVE